MLKVLYIGEAPYKVLGELVKPTLAQAWNVPENALVSVQISDDIDEMKKAIAKGAMNQEKTKERGKYSAEGTTIVLERTSKDALISLVHKFASNAKIDLRDNYEPADLEELEEEAIQQWAQTGRVPTAEPDLDDMDFDAMFDGGDDGEDLFGDSDSTDSLFDGPDNSTQSSEDYAPAATPVQRITPTNHNAPPMPGEGPNSRQEPPQRDEQRRRREPEPPSHSAGEPDINNIPGFNVGGNQLPSPPPRPPEPPQVAPEQRRQDSLWGDPPMPPQEDARRGRHSADSTESHFPVPPEQIQRETYRQQTHRSYDPTPSFNLDHDTPTEREFKQDIFGERDYHDDREPPTQSIDMPQGGYGYPQDQPGQDPRYGFNPNQGYQQYPQQNPDPRSGGWNGDWNGGNYGSQPGGWNQPPQQHGYPPQQPGQDYPGAGWPGNGPQPRGDIVPFMQNLPEDAQRRQSHSAEIQRAAGSIRHDEGRHNKGLCIYITGNRGGIGKSTVAWVMSNLLSHLRQSQGGRQVWLIEADYKNPKMEMHLRNMGRNIGNLVEPFRNINPNTSPERIMELIKSNSVQIPGSNLRILPAPFNFDGHDNRDIGWILQRLVQFLTGLGDTVFVDAGNVTSQNYEPLDQVLAGRLATHCVVVSTPKFMELGMRSVITLTGDSFGKTSNSVHIFMNRSNKDQLNEATNFFATSRIGTVGAFPVIDELHEEWVGETTPEINQALVARAGLTLSSLGFPEARTGFGEVEVDIQKRPGLIRRLMDRMGL